MPEESSVRRRFKVENKGENGKVVRKPQTLQFEFTARESPLTVLRESSPHIRAIYHIFIVILIILLFDTLVYDFVERGRINLGTSAVFYGFGDVRRCVKLWLFEFALALLFYPGLRLYIFGARILRKKTALRRVWSQFGLLCLIGLLSLLIMIPVVDLAKEHLALASSCIVTLELIRFSMKIISVSIACAPKCEEAKSQPTFKNYLYFLFAPTLLYSDNYPRTNTIRWGVVAYHLLEVIGIIFYNSFLWELFILPNWSDYGKEPTVEAGKVVRSMFSCILPGLISFLSGFYCLLHAWLNATAEMLQFADRLFYEEWWTMSRFSAYYRSWNRVVYSWLRVNIYSPLVPTVGRSVATLVVFLVSSVCHELVLSLSFGFFYPVLLVEFGVFGLLCVPLTATAGRRFPNLCNLIMWLSFFCGNGLLWSLYPMEFFARQNCPPSDNDSFFIPKSWSCPKIVMKTNWKFNSSFID